MGTIQSQKIGLRIAGTKLRQGGFAPLVAVGILAGDEGNNMDKITVVAEKPVYVIKHTNDYILYQLIDRKVKPCDRDTVGILSIALTIARDVQLANSKSPYSLLKEVYDKFVSDYMEHSSDGLDSFLDKNIDQSIFVSILEQYPLESRSSAYIPMNPAGMSGTLCVSQDKMNELFRDSQYKEFASFKEIEIGVSCMTMPGLENIEIPRPKMYSVIVNDTTTGVIMKKSTDSFNTATILHDTQDITYDNTTFYLSDLLESPNHKIEKGKSSVELDDIHNRILCKVHKKENTYTLEYFVEGSTEKNRQRIVELITANQIKLTIGSNTVEFPSNSPQKVDIPASYAGQNVSITPNFTNTHRFSVNSSVNNPKRSINVTIVVTALTTSGTIAQSNSSFSGNASSQSDVRKPVQRRNETDETNNNSNIDTNTNKSNTKKSYKKLIFLFVGIVLGMGIGFGTHPITKDKISNKDSILNYKNSMQLYKDSMAFYKDSMQYYKNAYNENKEVQLVSLEEENIINVSDNSLSNINDGKKKDLERERVRTEILEYVNRKDITKCRKLWGDTEYYLEKREKNAVEAVLGTYTGTLKKKIEKVLKVNYNSWDELEHTRKEIEKILNEKN